jgi:hypothetical protein
MKNDRLQAHQGTRNAAQRKSQFLNYKSTVKRKTERHKQWPHQVLEQQANVTSA